MPELVVAHYTEDLSWLRNLPKDLQITVYDKSPAHSAGSTAIPLPNMGREAHTYLYHIISRYDSLPEWTLFCQGKPFDHAYDFKKTLRAFADGSWFSSPAEQHANPYFYWLGHLIDTDDAQGHRLFRPWSKNDDGRGLDLQGFHQALFSTAGPAQYTFVLGAQFAVHRNLLHQKTVSFYEQALTVSTDFPDAAHCFERSWDRVFGTAGIDPYWLADRLTVRLKPMKHQSTE